VRAVVLGAVLLMGCGVGSGDASEDLRGDRADERARMVREQIAARGVRDPRVLAAMEAVPRDIFVPADSVGEAYAERALPIDCGQTISAPAIVGIMTAALDVSDRDRVLEIGTGSGYQAAVLAKLARRVYTVDRFRTLVAAAEQRCAALNLSNITTRVGDGMKGWPEQAPFDKIVITAAGETVPELLLAQVRIGGIIVAPVGPPDGVQKLVKIIRTEDGYERSVLADVRFVPLIPGTAARL
jgi:protein-L-isoaspartate(D-aspartate) O-methyltransferase